MVVFDNIYYRQKTIMKPITLLIDQDIQVPLEDLFKGGYSAHKVEGLVDTWAIVKETANKQPSLVPYTNATTSIWNITK